MVRTRNPRPRRSPLAGVVAAVAACACWGVTACAGSTLQCNGADLPTPAANTLLLIATELEAGDLVPEGTEPCWQGGTGQAAYRFPGLTIAITGPTGHAMSTTAARLVVGPECGGGYERLINFGAVGVYLWSQAAGGTGVGKAYVVSRSQQWDQFIPLRGYEYFTRELSLAAGPEPAAAGSGGSGLVCLSAARFSSDNDRSWPVFLGGDFEDLELYSVAWLAESLDLPLLAIKFVTNVVSPTGAEDFLTNLPAAFAAGCELLSPALGAAWPAG